MRPVECPGCCSTNCERDDEGDVRCENCGGCFRVEPPTRGYVEKVQQHIDEPPTGDYISRCVNGTVTIEERA